MALNLQEAKISKAVSLVISLANKKITDDVLSEGVLPIQLQIGVKKIPKDQKHLKMKLPHPIAKPGGDICLFVKDLDKKERDTEPTVAYYEDLLAKKGVKNIKEIIPIKALKTDYKPYEAKWNLSNAYDTYIADERVVTCLPRLLGKNFYGRKKEPTQLNLLATDLKGEFDKALKSSKFAFSNKGNTSMALIGHSGMNQEYITANLMAAVDQISSSIPGKSANIKQLYVKAFSCTSVPIYMSEGGPQDVKIKAKKEKKPHIEVDELSTLEGDAKVAVYPSGKVLILKNGQTLKQAEEADRRANTKRKRKIVESSKSAGKDESKAKKAKRSNGVQKMKKIKGPKATAIRKKIK